jgi:hypothetical protein
MPHTRLWSRPQKRLIVAVALVGFAALSALVYTFERYCRLPDDSILVGTWEMTTPAAASSYTLLRLDPDDAAWHRGLWIRRDISDRDGRGAPQGDSEMSWYAGGSYIYMHFVEESPQIWRIVDVLPNELRLRHAKQDYIFKRLRWN